MRIAAALYAMAVISFAFTAAAAILGGYVINLVDLASGAPSMPGSEIALRALGVLIPILGAAMGWWG